LQNDCGRPCFLRLLTSGSRNTFGNFAPHGFLAAKTAATWSLSAMPLHDIAVVGAFIVVFSLLLAVGRYMGSYKKKRRQYHD
jgi:hypothetical protein